MTQSGLEGSGESEYVPPVEKPPVAAGGASSPFLRSPELTANLPAQIQGKNKRYQEVQIMNKS